jgi:FKBP-type peptidyl-prolyl cis-trans isomerase
MEVVQGFAYALKKMKEGEEAVVFFSSDYGYQATTSGQIQPYSMLRFDIKVGRIGRTSD